jgi:hypothetical protein
MTSEQGKLTEAVESIKLAIQQGLGENSAITAAAFYGNPPWKAEDLDVLVVTNQSGDVGIADTLQQQSNAHRLVLDTWILTEAQLTERMKRIAGVSPGKPPIQQVVSNWEGFSFVPVLGRDFLETTITDCYDHPEAGGPIPPTPEEKMTFQPE